MDNTENSKQLAVEKSRSETVDYGEILKQMTLEEKASLCSGKTFWLTENIDRLGIPSVLMTDGPNGLRKEKAGRGTNIMNESEPATCFPTAVTLCSTWDPSLAEKAGKAIADEAKEQGQSTVLGPGVNIKRSPLCGRNFEYFSEDPYLAGEIGKGWVHGVQSENIGVSLKHYCANNQEHIRMSVDTIADERALREIYLPAFENIVKDEQPTTVMASYNRLNGKYLCDNKRMLTEVLRDEWGFKGIVVSDWGAVNDRVEGVKAGLDLEMPGNNGINDKLIVEAVRNGTLDEADLDKVALRMIKFAFECKAKEVENHKADFEAHHTLAREIGAAGAVLLKNEENILPVKSGEKIAVIGQLAKVPRYQGAGSSNINPYKKPVSFIDALTAANREFTYADGYTLKGNGYDKGLIKKAVKIAKGADKVLLFIGLTDSYESEGFDRKHLNMPNGHEILFDAIKEVNPNVAVVFSGGSPVDMREITPSAKALLSAYLGGQAVGEAVMDVLYGDVNPSGKLAETWPLRLHDNIASKYFPMGPKTVEYRESVYVGYRFFDTAKRDVMFPFGYGLSYTTFEYSDLKLSKEKFKDTDSVEISFKIKNTGSIDGAEVAQVYISDVESTIFRPEKELKRFSKVFLKAGESKEIKFTLDKRCFAYYNVDIKDWHVESGDFKIMVGASSRDIRLEKTVSVESSAPSVKVPDYRESAPCYYTLVDEKFDIPAEQFEALYGAPLPDNSPYKKGEFNVNCTVGDVSISRWGKFIQNLLHFGVKVVSRSSQNKDMLLASVDDMPIRSFYGFTGGMISAKSVDGLIDMFNGKRGGFNKFIKGFKKTKEEKAKK